MRTIIRSGYTVHRKRKTITVHRKDGKTFSYTRKAGMSKVRAVPTKDVGAIGKGPKVIGKLKAGMLTRYHYPPVEATTNRRKALTKAVRQAPRAWPSSKVAWGLTLTNTISTTAACGW